MKFQTNHNEFCFSSKFSKILIWRLSDIEKTYQQYLYNQLQQLILGFNFCIVMILCNEHKPDTSMNIGKIGLTIHSKFCYSSTFSPLLIQ